jgi:predicted protein tyrosine phosphatase
MYEVFENIFVGSRDDLRFTTDDKFAFVHATKTVFKKDNHEVVNEESNHLWLNWVDATDSKYFDCNNEGVEVFIHTLDFIDKWIADKCIFIHCDEGVSRSPSIAMVYLAKRAKAITDKDHVFAEREFQDIYPKYNAGKGVSDFLFKNWFKIK